MNTCRRGRRGFLLGLAGAAASSVRAQFRSSDTPALPRSEPPADSAPLDAAPDFARAYRRAGEPAVMLLWNRAYSDRTHADVEERQTVTERSTSTRNALDKTTSGPAGTARMEEHEQTSENRRTTAKGSHVLEEARPQLTLEVRHALMLERSFMAAMNRGGMRFVDRAVAMRNSALKSQRSVGERQMIETEAARSHADVLLEVLWVPDKDAPANYAFDVRAKRLEDGRELLSLYTRAVPQRPAVAPAAWVAGKDGYELRAPPAPAPATPVDVGNALARDVMVALGSRLEQLERSRSVR